MIALKSMIALSVLVSAGLVTAYDITAPQSGDQSAAAQVAQRFPRADEAFRRVIPAKAPASEAPKPVAAGAKGDKLPSPASCGQREWPYIDQACLVSADGSPVRNVSRFVTIERRVDESTSELVRVPASALAAR